MLACYITPDAANAVIDLSRFADAERWTQALNASTYFVGSELRKRGFDLTRLYIPRMFDSSSAYSDVTKSANYTSGNLSALGEQRLVIDFKTENSAVFTLEGSQDGTTFVPVKDVTGEDVTIAANKGRSSVLFVERYTYFRYKLVTSESVTYSIYLMDTAADMAILYKAAALILFPYIGADEVSNGVYRESEAMHKQEIDSIVLSYDLNDDGTVSEEEQDVVYRSFASR